MPKEIFPFSKEVCKASYGLNCGTCKKCCSNPPALMFDEVYKYRHYLTPCLHLDFSPLSFFLSGFPASLHEEALAQFKKRYILFSEKEKDGKPAGESGTFVFMPILAIDDFNADGMCCMFQQGKCRLEDDKPLRCRALPLEGDMPECMLIDNLQYVQKKYHCKGLKIHPEPAEDCQLVYADGKINCETDIGKACQTIYDGQAKEHGLFMAFYNDMMKHHMFSYGLFEAVMEKMKDTGKPIKIDLPFSYFLSFLDHTFALNPEHKDLPLPKGFTKENTTKYAQAQIALIEARLIDLMALTKREKAKELLAYVNSLRTLCKQYANYLHQRQVPVTSLFED